MNTKIIVAALAAVVLAGGAYAYGRHDGYQMSAAAAMANDNSAMMHDDSAMMHDDAMASSSGDMMPEASTSGAMMH